MSNSLRLTLAERIDAASDRFESEWRAGREPRIEDFLADAAGPDRAEWLRSLLGIELELRIRNGEAPPLDSYRERFANLAEVVEEVIRDVESKRSAGDTSVSRASVRTNPAPASDTHQTIPRQIGRFEVVALLGEGAFGQVFRARDPQLDREVAVKVPRNATAEAGFDLQRFLREARSAGQIRHPNVCPVYEVGEADDRPFIVMAYVRGGSLADHLAARADEVWVVNEVGHRNLSRPRSVTLSAVTFWTRIS